MITRIIIQKLYNLYDYDLSIPEKQFVSIFTGPNGFGKTTVLKIINNLFLSHYSNPSTLVQR